MDTGWIKLSKRLAGDPRLLGVAARCRISANEALGALARLWFLADDYAEADDKLPNYTKQLIDGLVGVPGFCDSLPPDWFSLGEDGSIYLPAYQAHNGTTARARTSRAIDNSDRKWQCSGEHVRARVREEKRREEEKTPLPPKGEGRFGDFWKQYPRKVGKKAALKAWQKCVTDAATAEQVLRALPRHIASTDWQKDGGRYIPHASTWLNGRRWEDELGGPGIGHGGGPPPVNPDLEAKVRQDREDHRRLQDAAKTRTLPITGKSSQPGLTVSQGGAS